MSVLLMKVLWYRYDNPDQSYNITDCINTESGRGVDIKNNVVLLTLRNPAVSLDSNYDTYHRYVDTSGLIKFEEQDQIRLYLKYSDDMEEVESEEWSNSTTITPDENDLKGIYYVIEFEPMQDSNKNDIKIRCADKTYIIFNKLLSRSFLRSGATNAPEIIQKVIRFSCQSEKGEFLGTGSDPNVRYEIDARLDSERTQEEIDAGITLIQDTRKSTYEDGDANTDTTFPDISIAKVWKPVYEWVKELSQIEFINTNDELTVTNNKKLVYGRPFIYYVDEKNTFHWFETNDTIDDTITIGTTTGIYKYNLPKKVFDSFNFIVFRGGENFYGKGTLFYYIDDTSNLKSNKMKVIAMTDIATALIEKEISLGNVAEDSNGSFTFSGVKYARQGTVTPHWTSTSYSSDSTYNAALETEIERLGRLRARSIVGGFGRARYKGYIERKGCHQTVGDLITVTNLKQGVKSENLRVVSVRDIVNKNGWFTTLEVEQDIQKIYGGDVT